MSKCLHYLFLKKIVHLIFLQFVGGLLEIMARNWVPDYSNDSTWCFHYIRTWNEARATYHIKILKELISKAKLYAAKSNVFTIWFLLVIHIITSWGVRWQFDRNVWHIIASNNIRKPQINVTWSLRLEILIDIIHFIAIANMYGAQEI